MALQSAPPMVEQTNDDSKSCWLNTFLKQEQNSFFCRIDDSFLGEKFELFDLDNMVTNYQLALNLIRNIKSDEPNTTNEEQQQFRQQIIEQNAGLLYGLIHARFILSKAGLLRMRDKYYAKQFGVCIRHDCLEQSLLPIGITDEINKQTVRLYCANCNDLYIPQNEVHRNMDGAYFGTTFAHYFLMSFPHLIPRERTVNPYIPKIFGFKLHESWHDAVLYGKYSRTRKNKERRTARKEDKKENKVQYLKLLCVKQTEEILRLDQVIKKQKKDIKKHKAVKKQLVAAETQIDLLQQHIEELEYNEYLYAQDTGVAAIEEPLQEYYDDNEEHYERKSKKSKHKKRKKKSKQKRKKVSKKEVIVHSDENLDEKVQQRREQHVYRKEKVAIVHDEDQNEDEDSLTVTDDENSSGF